MLRTLMSALRRRRTPAPPPSRATPVGEVQMHITADPTETAAVLAVARLQPARTPGLATARRHTWTATHHALAGIRDADAYADAREDPARVDEAPVRLVAALHQIDTALEELAAARHALTAITSKESTR